MKRIPGFIALCFLAAVPMAVAQGAAPAKPTVTAVQPAVVIKVSHGHRKNKRVAATFNPFTLSFTPGVGTPPGVSYNVYRGTAASGEAATPIITGAAPGCIVAPCLIVDSTVKTGGTTYFYQLTAVAGGSESGKSNEVFGTVAVVPPLAPGNLSAAAVGGSIVLSYTPGSDVAAATSYNVYRATASGAEAALPVLTGRAAGCGLSCDTIFDVTATTPGVTYFYQLAAVVAGVIGPKSNEASAMIPGVVVVPLASPTNVRTTKPVTILWSESVPVTGFYVFRAMLAGSVLGPYVLVGTTPATSFADNVPPGTYFYEIVAYGTSGQSVPTVGMIAVVN